MHLEGNQDEEEDIAIELDVLQRNSAHKNIARFYGAYLNENPIQLWYVSILIHMVGFGFISDW